MRTTSLFVCALVSGCAGRVHTEFVGTGTAIVQPRTEVAASSAVSEAPWAVARGMQLPAGSYELAMAFDIPRAQEVEWTISCPGVSLSGIAGETFESYRARRLAEMREQVRRDRERVSAASGAVIGTFAPRAVVGAPGVRVEATVNADAAGAAIAAFLAS